MAPNIGHELRKRFETEMDSGEFEIITRSNKLARWCVLYLAAKKAPFRAIHLGYGVKKVTSHVDTCPKCGGTGKC